MVADENSMLDGFQKVGVLGEFFIKAGKVEIHLDGTPSYMDSQIILDGKDITKMTVGFALIAHIGEFPKLYLDIISI